MATYYDNSITYTKDGTSVTKSIKYFKALPTEISVYGNGSIGINSATAKNSGIYGINGTFYQMNS